MKLLRLAALGAAIAAAVAFAGVGRPDRATGDTSSVQTVRTITVTGDGSVSAKPDQAVFTFGVSTRGSTAARALESNSEQARKLIDALKATGIPAASLRTSSVSLSARTNEDGSEIVGYQASNSVSATIAKLDRAGSIVDAAVAAGANEVDGPSLTVSDQSALYRSALKAAVADARAKADVLAGATGLHVGAVSSVSEEGTPPTPVTFDAAKAAGSSTPIEGGTEQISAAVTVVFEVA